MSLCWRNIIHLIVEDIFPYVINLQPAKGKGLSAKLADWTLIWLITKLIGLLNVRIRRVLRFFWLFPIELGVLIHVRDLPRLHPIVPSLLCHPLHYFLVICNNVFFAINPTLETFYLQFLFPRARLISTNISPDLPSLPTLLYHMLLPSQAQPLSLHLSLTVFIVQYDFLLWVTAPHTG